MPIIYHLISLFIYLLFGFKITVKFWKWVFKKMSPEMQSLIYIIHTEAKEKHSKFKEALEKAVEEELAKRENKK